MGSEDVVDVDGFLEARPPTAKPHPNLIRRLCWIPWDLEPLCDRYVIESGITDG